MRRLLTVLLIGVAGSLVGNAPLLSAPARLSFTDITATSGMTTYAEGSHGVMFADVDDDYRTDTYLTFNFNYATVKNQFLHAGVSRFFEQATRLGIADQGFGTHGAAWADLDNDGDLDLINGVTYGDQTEGMPNRLFRNEGRRFTDVTPPAFLRRSEATRAILAFDADSDGDLDIFAVSGYLGSGDPATERNESYRNLGRLRFSEDRFDAAYTAPAGEGATDTDFDGDGDIDVLAANPGGEMVILQNSNRGTFSLVSASARGIAHQVYGGITSGDLDNDGILDLVLADPASDHAYVYLGTGNGRFRYNQTIDDFVGYTAGLADLDNDGDLDLAASGLERVFVNDGRGGFIPGATIPNYLAANEDPRSVAFADIDRDGDLDFICTAKKGTPRVYRNDYNAGNWLKVKLVSPLGQNGAFGAKVRLYQVVAGQRGPLLGMREAKSNYGYLAQDDPVLHFGLRSRRTVLLEVAFLGVARTIRMVVHANQTVVVRGSP